MTELDYGAFEALTFDCYGTLIDWEAGILAGLRATLDPAGVSPSDDELLERYAAAEAALEAGPYLRYRDVLGRGLQAVAATFGVRAGAVGGGGVRRLRRRLAGLPGFRRRAGPPEGPLPAGCPHELRRRPLRRVGPPPRRRVRLGRDGAAGGRLQAPAGELRAALRARRPAPRADPPRRPEPLPRPRAGQGLGLSTVWIDRRHDRPGFGATPPAEATPDAIFPDMATFAAAAAAPPSD